MYRTRGYLLTTAACILWGFAFFFGKLAMRELAPMHVVLGRFIIAGVVFLPVLWRRHRLRREDWRLLVAASLMVVPGTFILQFEGLALTSATSAALLVGAFPPMQALAAQLFGSERPGLRVWSAALASAGGVMLMVGNGGMAGASRTGDLMVLAGVLSSVGGVLATQRLLHRYASTAVTAWTTWLGLIVLVPVALVRAGLPPAHLSLPTWGALLGLGLLCTAGTYSLWNAGLRYIPSAHAGVIINIEPLMGALLGVLFLGDAPGWRTLAGGLLVLGAALSVALQRPVKLSKQPPVQETVTEREGMRQAA